MLRFLVGFVISGLVGFWFIFVDSGLVGFWFGFAVSGRVGVGFPSLYSFSAVDRFDCKIITELSTLSELSELDNLIGFSSFPWLDGIFFSGLFGLCSELILPLDTSRIFSSSDILVTLIEDATEPLPALSRLRSFSTSLS